MEEIKAEHQRHEMALSDEIVELAEQLKLLKTTKPSDVTTEGTTEPKTVESHAETARLNTQIQVLAFTRFRAHGMKEPAYANQSVGTA